MELPESSPQVGEEIPPESRTRFISHAGQPILLFDFTQVNDPSYGLRVLHESQLFVSRLPKVRNVRSLVDITGSTFNPQIVDGLNKLAAHNKPWVLASAVLGMSPLARIVMRMMSTFSGRKFATFRTREQALEWLLQQKEPPAVVPQAPDE